MLGLLPALAAGCSFTVGHVALFATRDVDLRPRSERRHVRERSCVPIVFVFPAGRLPSLSRAVDAAIQDGGGSVMRDAVVRFQMWYVPFAFGNACYIVQGDVS